MIGTGPASISAAQAVRSQDPGGSIVLIGDEPHGYYSRPGLAYYLADEVPERQLFPFRHEDFAHLGVQLFLKRAVAIDPAGHRVTLENGQVIPYDRLLIATGARATPLKIPGADLDGVVTLDNMDDAHQLIRRGRRGKTAAVVGGGITALEIAEGLHARRVHVHYLMRKDRYWGDVLSASESRIVEQAVRASGVEIHHFAELAQVIGQRGRVAGVETVAGERIPCDLLGVAIGVLPRTALAVAAGLRCARGILVDQHLRSSDKDIYAAGDVAEVYEPLTDRNTLEVLWSSAVAKGRIAGLNMPGQPTHVYEKGVSLNVTRLAGIKTTIMGLVGSGTDPDLQSLARGDSETWRQLHRAVSVEWQAGGDHIRLTLGDTNILGAVVMGDQAASFALRQLIADRVDVSGIRERFFEPTTAMSDLIQGFWTEWRAHHG